MKNLQAKTLALFFTKGMSLRKWEEIGILERELVLYKELANHFSKIYFFTYGDIDDVTYQRYLPHNIQICPNKHGIPLKLYSVLLPFFYIKEVFSSDILKTNQMSGSWAAVVAKLISGKKLIVRCGYEWFEVMERRNFVSWKLNVASFLEYLAYKAADVVVFSNEADKEYARKKFNINQKKLFVVPNFVDTELFKQLPVKKETGRIIFVGKLEDQKNIFQLIEAVSALPVMLIIIGSGSLLSKLKDFARSKNAPVEFLGNIPNSLLAEELNKSEVFVLPSLYEGHPKALVEAMSCGMACIGTNVKGINAVIKHEKNGYICELGAESIRVAIALLLNNETLRLQMGESARKFVVENFSLQKVLQLELGIYESIMSKR